MPAFLEVTNSGATEMSALGGVVSIDGQVATNWQVMSSEHDGSTRPSEAVLRYVYGENVSGPVSMRDMPGGAKFGSRVRIDTGGEVSFLGSLVARQDQGAQDAVVWTARDDRWLLEQIPVRGCLVYDPTNTSSAYTCKFIPRYIPRVNPEGQWNCIGATVGGILLPVFSEVAVLGKSYESPDEAAPALSLNAIVPWTARLWLTYLWAVANMTTNGLNAELGYTTGRVQGIRGDHWRCLYGQARLAWLLSSVTGMVGVDPATSEIDPLDRKLPDINFRGMKMLGAIDRTLQAVGTHGMRLAYQGAKSYVEFYPRGYSGLQGGNYIDIPLQRGGSADDIHTAHDFAMNEDASETFESVLVEGDVVRTETRATYTLTATVASSSIVPAWTTTELTAFRQMIAGSSTTTYGTYAKYPATQGDATFGNMLNADGLSNRPYALSRTYAAIALARMHFPRVFSAYRLQFHYDGTDQNAILQAALAGAAGEFANQNSYPRLKCTRPILPAQLQYLVTDAATGSAIENMLRVQYPVRVMVGQSSTRYVDSTHANGIRLTDDGLIWLDGLAETINGELDCLYSGDYTSAPLSMAAKRLMLQCAFPMDHRVFGYKDVGGVENSRFHPDFAGAAYGLPLLYVDSGEAYREHHQVASYPTSSSTFQGSTGSSPLTRILMPGSERVNAAHAADRKLAYSRHPRRSSTWRLIGIRPEYKAGTWVRDVVFRSDPNGIASYRIDAPIGRVVLDYVRQETVLHGLDGGPTA